MSESTTSTASTPPRRGGKKLFGLPRTPVIVFGVVFVGAIGWFLWKRHQSSTAAASTTAATGTTGTADTTDLSGQLSQIDADLQSLLAEGAGGGGAGSGGGYGGGSGGPTGTTGDGTGTTGDGTGTTPTSTTTTTTPTSGSGGGSAPTLPTQVTGLHATTVTSTAIGLAWTRAERATSYQVRVTYQDKVVGTHNLGNVNSYTVTGLTHNHTYGLHVVAKNAAGEAPEASIDQKTK